MIGLQNSSEPIGGGHANAPTPELALNFFIYFTYGEL
jgi:hypothetical protein